MKIKLKELIVKWDELDLCEKMDISDSSLSSPRVNKYEGIFRFTQVQVKLVNIATLSATELVSIISANIPDRAVS